MKIFLLQVLLILSFNCFAETHSDSLKSSKSSNITSIESSSSKNIFYFQFLGDTPTIGIGYRRVFITNKLLSAEIGAGIGFMPQVFNRRINPKPSKLTYSHSFVLVKNNEKLIKPYLGYSGVFYSGLFYKGKKYSYIPSPNVGLRIGKSDAFAFNLGCIGHFYKKEVPTLKNENELETFKNKYILIVPTCNFQYKF